MKRTQIYLREDQWKILKKLARPSGTDVSQLIREAIDRNYRTGYDLKEFREALQQAAGIWKDRKDIPPGPVYQRRMRRKWRVSSQF